MRVRPVLWALALLCLGAGAMLTALRMVQPGPGIFVRLVSLAPLALPAYLLALGLLATQLRRIQMRTVAPLLVVAAVGFAVHAWWLAPYSTGSEAEPRPGAARLQVMTINMLNGYGHPEDVVRAAADNDVDLLAVQEITPTALWAMEEAGINEQLPFHAGEALYGVRGTMLFSRTPLSAEQRIATQWTSFSVVAETGGRPVTVAVTHPESPMGDASGWRHDHQVLREAVLERQPDLVVGDFNATADHEAFGDLLDTGLRDASEVADSGRQPTWPSAGEVGIGPFTLPRTIAIDHVLVGERWTATRTETVTIRRTDHAAVVAWLARR